MEHAPSDYRATIDLSYQEMWELQKAIAQRVGTLIERGMMDSDEMRWLLQIGALINDHTTQAVEEWEAGVARSEAAELDNDEELRKFLDDK